MPTINPTRASASPTPLPQSCLNSISPNAWTQSLLYYRTHFAYQCMGEAVLWLLHACMAGRLPASQLQQLAQQALKESTENANLPYFAPCQMIDVEK